MATSHQWEDTYGIYFDDDMVLDEITFMLFILVHFELLAVVNVFVFVAFQVNIFLCR